MENNFELLSKDIDLSLLKNVSLAFVKANAILPIKISDGVLTAAVSDLNSQFAAKDLAEKFKVSLVTKTFPRQDILDAINRYYSKSASAGAVIEDISAQELSGISVAFSTPEDILEMTHDAPVIKFINALFQEALTKRASDIHIEPYEKDLEIRLRLDGILHKILTPPKIMQEAIISRIKIMAELDIAQKRLPQDGRIRLIVAGRDIDVRVSIMPTLYGERVVLRLLDRSQVFLGLSEIGLSQDMAGDLLKKLSATHGIFLVTGPTGSGKTTTLYALINQIRSEKINVMTVENPVEYQLKGIAQTQVNSSIGLTFANGLRAILRQNPDCILLGEIRDSETAQIAIQAALTGHLVLTTLHTNDAASAIARLVDLGVEPYLLSSSLLGVLAQRLVRTICPHCKKEYLPSENQLNYFKTQAPKKLYKGAGCSKCLTESFLGRSGIFELLTIDDSLRSLINLRASSEEVEAQAIKNGMRTIFQDGLDSVLSGKTTLEEVLRVVNEQ